MSFVTTRDSIRLRVKDWGTGPAVVLIHGWPLSADTWDAVAMRLVDQGFRVIAYDRRGFGHSEHAHSGYDYDTLSDDLLDVLRAKDISSASLVGFSMGGGEVIRFQTRHPQIDIKRAILIGSVVPGLLKTPDHPEGVDGQVFDGMKEAIFADRAGFFEEFFKGFYGVGVLSKPVSQGVLRWSHQMAMSAGLKATIDCVDAFGKTDFRSELQSMQTPTLIIHGDADATVPIDISGKAAAKRLSHSEIQIYEGSPHGLLATDQDRLIEDVSRFLTSS